MSRLQSHATRGLPGLRCALLMAAMAMASMASVAYAEDAPSEEALRHQAAFDARLAVNAAEQAVTAAERNASRAESTYNSAASRAASAKDAAAKKPDDKKLAEKATAAAAECAKAKQALEAAQAAATKATSELKKARLAAALAEDGVRGGLKPLAEDEWDYAKARHLLVRAGFGGTPAQVEHLHALGLHGAVDYLVEFTQQQPMDLAFNVVLPAPISLEERLLTPEQRRELSQQRMRGDSKQISDLRNWWMQRLVESPRPLEEKLVLFWHGHFATEYRTTRQAHVMHQQNELFRQHAAGNFGALLRGIVHDPAMLRYLDNNRNVSGRPNENLAREIMELFSLGVGNYTEDDIKEAARALTGYTYDTRNGQFRFATRSHDDGEKNIFGRKGKWTGDDLVDLILARPQAAEFVSNKLFEYFAYEGASDETVEALADVLRRHRYELTPLLKNIFLSEEFYSERSVCMQIKSPVQLVVGAYRDLGVSQVEYASLQTALRNMGQDLFDPPNVKGWLGGRSWVNSNLLFHRYNALADAIERIERLDQQRGIDVLAAMEGQQLESAEEIVDYLIKVCLVVPLDESQRQALVEFVGDLPPRSSWDEEREQINARLRAVLVHLMSMPPYQLT